MFPFNWGPFFGPFIGGFIGPFIGGFDYPTALFGDCTGRIATVGVNR